MRGHFGQKYSYRELEIEDRNGKGRKQEDKMASPSDDSSSGSSDKTPQAIVSEFWDKFVTKKPGKVTSIFPRSLYATLLPRPHDPRTSARAHNAAESYEAAAEACRQRVEAHRE